MDENKIYVAVGNEIEERESTLNWAFKLSRGETICAIYVHVPAPVIRHTNSFRAPLRAVRGVVFKENQARKRKKVAKMLDDCLKMYALYQVPSEKIIIEKDSVADGILELISQLGIRKLVMGAGANNKNLRKLTKPTSRKSTYVLQHTPDFCHIWFVCEGHLICTREGLKQLNQHLEENECNRLSYSEPSVDPQSAEPAGSSLQLTQSTHHGLSPATTLHALAEAKREEACEGSERQQKAEKEPMEAIHMLKAGEDEITQITNKAIQIELNKILKMLLQAPGEFSSLEGQNEECNLEGEEMEEKTICTEKFQKYKKQCDKVHIECDISDEVVRVLRKQLFQETSSSNVPEFYYEFSQLDLEEATKFFHPSLRIQEGDYSSVYKGLLHHTQVAIKNLKPESLHGIAKFKQEVDILSKVRHPNLVTLIGVCPDSLALIYEYLPNGSLEDRLCCKDNTLPLPWQTRIRIATELCSVLNFLHSIEPSGIILGNLNPKNILLDANFYCKISGSGVCHIIPNNKQTFTTDELMGPYSYIDPEFLETGHLSPLSDVYSFGMILLRLLTGKPSSKIVKKVFRALINDHLHSILDPSAGDWPVVHAKHLAYIALKCCDVKAKYRPDLHSEVWSVLNPAMTLSETLSSPLLLVSGDQVPSYFICPIFQEIMRDPHTAADGFTYESDAIRGWFEGGHYTSPMTNLKIDNQNLTPNRALRSAIQEWLQKHQHV